jgi:hypothetical protein
MLFKCELICVWICGFDYYYLYKVKNVIKFMSSEIDRIHIDSRQIEKIGIKGSRSGLDCNFFQL